MIPKTINRDRIIEHHLHVFREPHHDLSKYGLPQFIPQPYQDPHELIGLKKGWENDPELRILHSSTKEIPEEFKHVPKENIYGEEIFVPFDKRDDEIDPE